MVAGAVPPCTPPEQTSIGNPASTDLKAIYSFPVPEEAAVSEFTIWIDEVDPISLAQSWFGAVIGM